MIVMKKVKTMNWEGALRGMRNPKQSWEKSDSIFDCPSCEMCPEFGKDNAGVCHGDDCSDVRDCCIIGQADMKLAKQLIKAGSDERKFLREILVSVDIKAPLYWWKEYDTYKVGTVANSESTMHKIHAKEFTTADFSHENLTPRSMKVLNTTIEELNFWRDIFNNGGAAEDMFGSPVIYEPKDKTAWHQMIELLPTSYNQMRTCTLNYEVLLNQYFARRNHKLMEWREYCAWAEKLPYFKQFKEVLEK